MVGAEQNPPPTREPKGPSILIPQQARPSSLEGASRQHQTAPKPARQTEGSAPELMSGRNSLAAGEHQTPPPHSPFLQSPLTPPVPCELKSAFKSLPSSMQAFVLCCSSWFQEQQQQPRSRCGPHQVSRTQSLCPLHVCTVTVTKLPSSPASLGCPLSAPAHTCLLHASRPSSPLAEKHKR